MLRRKLGYVVQEGIQPQDSARHAAQPGEIQRIAVQPGRHFAALEQGGHVVPDARKKIARRIAQAGCVLDQHDRVFRQIVERSRHLRIDEWQVLVRSRQAAGLLQPFGVALNVRFQLRMLFPPCGQRTAHGPGKAVHAARRKVRQRFHARQAAQSLNLLKPPLAAYVKGRNRIDFVVPELDAIGVRCLRREHVQNAAAHRELSRALDLDAALIARAGKLLCQSFKRRLLTCSDGHDRAFERRGRQGALQRGLHGCDRKPCAGQCVQHGKPLLLVAARHADHVHHDKVARGKLQYIPLCKALQIRGKTCSCAVVVGQHEHRAAGVQPKRRREMRLVNGRQADCKRRGFPLLQRVF